ncbi:hypothetical protein CLV99_4190 [Sphingobacterium yanglingense]|uniref:Uncharacterized protein n=1 Tax=Sphingobacterium yanglingense TaxID=1437280 RepID=A0A4V3DCV2_9SPHI|nr:hypothetical protein CLV99_4190 [Sphingobacterium yanglingense]
MVWNLPCPMVDLEKLHGHDLKKLREALSEYLLILFKYILTTQVSPKKEKPLAHSLTVKDHYEAFLFVINEASKKNIRRC